MNSRLSIVVDADIARSSGSTEHPTSSGSRRFLVSVKDNGHKLAICPILMGEWKKHRSIFAAKWLASMIARKKVVFLTPIKMTEGKVDSFISNEKQREVGVKDAHLIDAALVSDGIVASNDETARKVFCVLANDFGDIKNIRWFNVVSDGEFLTIFLKDGCFVPNEFYLS